MKWTEMVTSCVAIIGAVALFASMGNCAGIQSEHSTSLNIERAKRDVCLESIVHRQAVPACEEWVMSEPPQ